MILIIVMAPLLAGMGAPRKLVYFLMIAPCLILVIRRLNMMKSGNNEELSVRFWAWVAQRITKTAYIKPREKPVTLRDRIIGTAVGTAFVSCVAVVIHLSHANPKHYGIVVVMWLSAMFVAWTTGRWSKQPPNDAD
jgi:hypothetical protein